jgi:hypothetical protein
MPKWYGLQGLIIIIIIRSSCVRLDIIACVLSKLQQENGACDLPHRSIRMLPHI